MADRQDSDREVLTSLPRSRPVRRSAKRAERPSAQSGATAPPRRKTAAQAEPAKARPAKARPAKARPAKAKAGAKAPPPPRSAPNRKVPPAGYAAPDQRAADQQVSGAAALIGTTFQAAAELAQIGVTIGRQTLRSMLDRLPKP